MIDLELLATIASTAPGNFHLWEALPDDDGPGFLEAMVLPFNDELKVSIVQFYEDGEAYVFNTGCDTKAVRAYMANPITKPVAKLAIGLSHALEWLRKRLKIDGESSVCYEINHLFDAIQLLFALSGYDPDLEVGVDE
jgi:hypothetical protein